MTRPARRQALPATPGERASDDDERMASGRGRGPRSMGLLVCLGIAALIGILGFLALGIWQVQRLGWKQALIARVESRIHAQPVPAPGPAGWAASAADEYRRVRLSGSFQQDRATFVQAVTERGGGYWQMTPLRSDAGFTVLVNRGFVTPDQRSQLSGPASALNGQVPVAQVRVTGLLRLSEPGGGFLRHNDPAADRWYSRDVAAIAAARGLGERSLGEVAPYFVDADATPDPAGFPVGGLTVLRFANNHLVYALTWFALALMLAAAAAFVIRGECRLRRAVENEH
ncbi:surfeit locus 1 family protein [Bosea psychrotolerans]|uniref:SURF1-like protein n=2 Tax=Bosea psychrotolerans TaxID=1871628 RepID=A0A2S4MET4_9HYPH|nr:surfeit locus 1 family protein [Bosea psychrotolerans]